MKFYPCVFLLFLFSFFTGTLFAQTIAITNFDPGPYSPGSSIAVPFHIDDAAGCIGQTNTFKLFLSNASGVYPANPLVTVSGFYATYINAVIPNGTPSGNGYKVKVVSSANPAATAESPAFTISAGSVVTATITSPSNIDNGVHPDVFGNCNNTLTNFNFTDNSSNATSVTANFINESTQSNVSTVNLSTGGSGTFSPDKTNYTVIVKATNGTVEGTKAYTLVNNPSNSNFGFSGTQSVCLGSTLTFNIDIVSQDGIQFNYPGNTYKFDWGDGNSTILTFCQIKAQAGHVSHQYSTSSCGSVVGTVANVFKISFEPNNPYCGGFNAVSTTAKVSAPPTNAITGSATACAGAPITFTNSSYPGEDPNSTAGNCIDYAGAKYTWKVDGVIATGFSGVPKSKVFNPTLSAGPHTITLQLDNNPTSCSVADATFQICVQTPPTPTFDITTPAPVCLAGNSASVSVINTTVEDNSCFVNPFSWKVTTGTGTSLTTVATSTLANPTFTFTNPAIYTITLTVTDACGANHTLSKNVTVNGPPVALLAGSATASFCGPQILTFNNTANNATRVTYSGTAGGTVSYSWSVTPQGAAAPATFAGVTTAASQYPQINFPSVGDYTVSVSYTNSCGTTTSNIQTISIKQAPVPTAAATSTTVCVGDQIHLTSSVTTTDPYTIQWTDNAAGGTFNDNTALNPVYTPLPGKTGAITLTLQVFTAALPSPCNEVTVDVPVTITPPSTGITNTTPDEICDGNALNHALTSSGGTGDSYIWSVTQATNVTGANGQNIPGVSAIITDQLQLLNKTISGQVIYTITPYNSNGCPGTPFIYTVTVNQLPVINPLNNADLCSNIAVNTVLQPTTNVPGTKYTWTAMASSANVTGYSTNTANPATAINDVLVNSGTTDETVTYTITPVSTSGCPGTPVSVTVTVHPQPTAAVADPAPALAEEICNQPAFQLNGNTPVVGTGKWTQPAGQTAVFTDDTNPQTTVTGLSGGNTYHFTWTITSGCGSSTPSTVTVTDYPASVGGTTNANTPVCTNNSDDVSLSGFVGNILYWQTSTDNGANWTTVANTTSTFHYTNIVTTTQFRAVIQSGNCSTAVSSVTTVIVTQQSITNNIITNSGANELCYNNTPGILNGSTPTGGDGINYSYQWQQSLDGINFSDITTGSYSSADYQPQALTQTTYFRRVVSSGICTGITSSYSNPVTITVDPDINANFTTQTTQGCAPFTIDQNNITVTAPNPNLTYTWYANTGGGDVVIPGNNGSPIFPGYQILNDNQSVTIKLTVRNTLGCDQSTSVPFSTVPHINAAFNTALTNNAGCAAPLTNALSVGFTNTSTPAVGGFTWDFGDGTSFHQNSINDPVSHDFAAAADGSDKIYTVTLIPDGCSSTTFIQQITVYPASPVAIIDPGYLTSCAPYDLTIINKSPGTNSHYDYYLTNVSDGTVMQQTTTDHSTVSFHLNPIVTTQYSLHMVATNMCGVTGSTFTYQITVNPSTVTAHLSISPADATGNIVGCMPFQTSFHNLSTGGVNYTYHIYDSNLNLIDQIDVDNTNTNDASYLFTATGTYYVSIAVNVAGGSCAAGVESDKIQVTVVAPPAPDFTSDATSACSNLTVNFTNSTPDQPNAPAASYTYLWDFGDGTTSTDFTPQPHTYDYHNSPYTVKLTATNANGCTYTTVKTDYIAIAAPPDFIVMPGDVINIPDYTFSFIDQTVGTPVSWQWKFDDGTTSTLKNPNHTYQDTGQYIVTLIVTRASGCVDSIKHMVQITGVPGQLYVPNAFMPGSLTDQLRVFTVIGSGIKKWDMRIYNNWGQVIFETTKLSNKGEPIELWDGKYKGQDVPQGGYEWQISATFINGTEWKGMTYKTGTPPKKSGIVNLIR